MTKTMAIVFLVLLVFTAGAQTVVINEVLAGPSPNPSDFSSQNTANANSLYSTNTTMQPPFNREYIELFNTHPCDTIDIGCYTLGSNANSGISGPNWGAFTFPQGTRIPPLGYLIVGGNDAQVPLNDFNISQYRQTSFNIQYLTGDDIRWFLRDAWGWIALYDPQGAPVDAIYWNDYPGTAGNLYTESEYQSPIVNTMACGGTKTHLAASAIPFIVYVGHIIPGSYLSFQRIQDGSPTWHATPVTPTPRAPNGIPLHPPSATYNITPDHCGNHDGEITVTIIPGGTGPYKVYWNGDTVPGTLTISNLPAGNHTIRIVDAFDCLQFHDTITVPDDAGPTLQFTFITGETCSAANGAITAQITGGTLPYTVLWNNSPTTGTPAISGLTEGIYTILVTDAKGCTATDSVTLNNHKEPLLSVILLSPDSCGLNKGQALAVVTGDYPPYSYLWNTNPPQTDSIASQLPSGTYSVTVTDGICTAHAQVTIPLIPGPEAEFMADPTLLYLEEGWVAFTDLTPGPIVSWLWDFDDGSQSTLQHPNHLFTSIGTFHVELTVIDQVGCPGSVSHPIRVKDITSAFFPNAFTPDDDGVNDRFKPHGIYISNFHLMIFDRFGRVVFASSDPESGWDGRINGIPAPGGVYVWAASFSHDFGDDVIKDLKLKGTVTLIR